MRGGPAGHLPAVRQRVTTQSVPPAEQFDFWRQQFSFVQLEPQAPSSKAGFRGEVLSCISRDGLACASVSTDAVHSLYGKGDSNVLLVGGILSGQLSVADAAGHRFYDSASGLLLLDCDRRSELNTSQGSYEFVYVAVPRALAVEAVGKRELPLSGAALTRLPETGLGSLLSSHTRAVVQHMEQLNADECSVAMATLRDLTVGFLQQLVSPARGYHGPSNELYAAAKAYISRQYRRSSLTAEHIAAELGCSRAHLYRAFQQNDDTVAASLRHVRLQKARALLQYCVQAPIGQIAFDCGYTDPAAFAKAFKREYGLSPSELRGASALQENARGT